jgi:hypothetical protein
MTLPFRALANRYPGETCYVVGKGPSLLNLNASHFTASGPVITLNEAIRKVRTLHIANEPWSRHTLFTMMKDGVYPKSCAQPCKYIGEHMVAPEAGETLLVSRTTTPFCFMNHAPRYVFDEEAELGVDWTTPSAVIAIKIAELMGCNRLVLLCFDGAVNGDQRFVADGLSEIRRHPDRLRHPANYRSSGELMRDELQRSPIREVEWVLPGAGVEA